MIASEMAEVTLCSGMRTMGTATKKTETSTIAMGSGIHTLRRRGQVHVKQFLPKMEITRCKW